MTNGRNAYKLTSKVNLKVKHKIVSSSIGGEKVIKAQIVAASLLISLCVCACVCVQKWVLLVSEL